ncbi:MAG: RNA 2',3'-cyclic phosphodiesterase [Candidatus Omnitrophota bacterium]
MRTFIAVELPQNIQEYLAQVQERFKSSGADIKWVKPDNCHLTLKFLGETDLTTMDRIIYVMEKVVDKYAYFMAQTSGLGAFGGLNSPRIIWIGIGRGAQVVELIQKKLDEELNAIGIPAETRPFSCHVSIGRVRGKLNLRNLSEKIRYSTLEPQQFRVEKIILFKSTLTPKGPIYERVKVASLKAT